jgi:ElaB/YqjD/DUF883 family membrane-anchored ribosome-binding protein
MAPALLTVRACLARQVRTLESAERLGMSAEQYYAYAIAYVRCADRMVRQRSYQAVPVCLAAAVRRAMAGGVR